MKLENKHNAPKAFMNFCADDKYSRGDSDYSVTDLLEEPRIVALKKMYPDIGVEDPYENPWKYIGTMFHSILEEYSPDDELSEERIFSEVDGVKISGAMDVQIIDEEGNVSIGDYKTTSVFSLKDVDKWEKQLNLYRWLVEREKGLTVTKLTIYAFLRDWKISMSEKIRDYPPTPGITVDIDLWHKHRVEDFVRFRIDQHEQCEGLAEPKLPHCTHHGRWPSGTLYTVEPLEISGPEKKKLFKTKREANKYYDGLELTEQMTTFQDKTFETYRRCKSYCDFSSVCSAWKEWKEERSEQI